MLTSTITHSAGYPLELSWPVEKQAHPVTTDSICRGFRAGDLRLQAVLRTFFESQPLVLDKQADGKSR